MPKIPKQRTGSGGWPDRRRVPPPPSKNGGCLTSLAVPLAGVLLLVLLGAADCKTNQNSGNGGNPPPSKPKDTSACQLPRCNTNQRDNLCDAVLGGDRRGYPGDELAGGSLNRTDGKRYKVVEGIAVPKDVGLPTQLRIYALGLIGDVPYKAGDELFNERWGATIGECRKIGYKQ